LCDKPIVIIFALTKQLISMLTDLEFAEEQYRQMNEMAKHLAEIMPPGEERDKAIDMCVDVMADCLARIRELKKSIK
jgi:hypothetical protein